MPGGLNEVVQPFGADASQYKSELSSVLPILREVNAAQKEFLASAAQMAALRGQASGAGLGSGSGDIAKQNAAIRDTLASLREYQTVVRDTASVVTSASAGYETMRASISEVGDAVDAHTALLQQFTRTHPVGGQRCGRGITHVVLDRASDAHDGGAESALTYAANLATVRDTARDTSSALADVATAAAAVRSSGSGGGSGGSLVDFARSLGQTTPEFAAYADAQRAAQAATIAAIRGASGGGGGGGGFSGGGGGGGGSILGGLFDRSPHDAAAQFGTVANWVKRVYPAVHWAMMATNEVLATLGPATIAAGAAGAVGLEGGQTAYTRLSAINRVGQSLGPALGQTPGGFLGIGDALQKAQTKADPAVWELMGDALNSVNYATKSASGGLGNFWQLGTNTIDMIDRFGASVAVSFKDGVGKNLNAVVSQGDPGPAAVRGCRRGMSGRHSPLNAIPVLPGVGGDLLSVLSAGTGALAKGTGLLANAGLLGPLLAGEAGLRYGPTLVGGAGALIGKLGGGLSGLTAEGGLLGEGGLFAGLGLTGATGGLGKILGTSARVATAEDVAAGSAFAEGDAIAGTGAAGVLGAAGGPVIAGAAALTYLVGKAIAAKTPAQQAAAAQNAALAQMTPTQGYSSLISDMTQAMAGASAGAPNASFMQTLEGGPGKGIRDESIGNMAVNLVKGLFGAVPSNRQVAESQAQQYATQFNQLLSAGPMMQQMLGGGTMQNAYDLADMAGIQMSQLTGLKPGSKAYAQIQQQLLGAQRGFQVMQSSPGVYGANVNAVQAMSGLQGTGLAAVNSAWDQVISNATGGTAAATGFAGGIDATKALGTVKQIAKALTGFASPAAQTAWAAFSSPSSSAPGLIQQAGSTADWLRTAMTVSGGAVNQGDFNSALGYQAKQLLPYAQRSPAATAQLSVLAQQMGYKGPVDNYKDLSKFIDQAAGSQAKFNEVMNKGTIATAGVSQQALQFGATMKQNTYAAMAGGATGLPQVSADMQKFKAAFAAYGGKIDTSQFKSAAQSIAGDFAAVGASGKDVSAIISQALSGKGLNASQIAGAIKQISGDMNAIQSKNIKVSATVDPDGLGTLKNNLATLQSKSVTARAVAEGMPAIAALGNAIAALQSRTVVEKTIVETIYTSSGQYAGTVASGAGNVTVAPSGGGAFARIHAQTGMLVPGFGSGDHVPALLEPGEAVVPRFLVPLVAPILKSHHVPGFAAGGVVPGGSLSAVDSQISAAWTTLDALYKKEDSATGSMLASLKQQVSNFWSTVLDPLYKAKDAFSSVSKSATTAAASTKAASTEATKLANSFTTAMNYARGVSGAAMTGQGFGTTGLISGMDPTQDTVGNQMQTYLTSVKSFASDLKTLTKGGLSKDILKQLIAAGPTQGDALAQSILGGGGTSGAGAGISQVNALWKQIGTASHALGAQAAMSAYGQHLSPTLQSGTITNVNINVSVPGGASGDLNLTTAQISEITAKVQAALLKQAKRNRQTGVALRGKSA